jgi:hypothetical protein
VTRTRTSPTPPPPPPPASVGPGARLAAALLILIAVFAFVALLLNHGEDLQTALLGAGAAGVIATEITVRLLGLLPSAGPTAPPADNAESSPDA